MTAPDATPEARDLAELIWRTSRADESTISALGADIVAGAILRSRWLAERDARIRAEALRTVANDGESFLGTEGGDYGLAWHYIRTKADRIEAQP